MQKVFKRPVVYKPHLTSDVPNWIGKHLVHLFSISAAYRADRRKRRILARLGGTPGLIGAIRSWIPLRLRQQYLPIVRRAPQTFEPPSTSSYVISMVSSFLRRRIHAGHGVIRLIRESWPASFSCLEEPSIIRRS